MRPDQEPTRSIFPFLGQANDFKQSYKTPLTTCIRHTSAGGLIRNKNSPRSRDSNLNLEREHLGRERAALSWLWCVVRKRNCWVLPSSAPIPALGPATGARSLPTVQPASCMVAALGALPKMGKLWLGWDAYEHPHPLGTLI